MKNINKKPITKSVLIIALLLLLSATAYAKPFTDAFKGGLMQINDFFAGEQYKPYSQAIDFFFFALLFISVYMIGVRYAFKEVKKPEKIIAIVLGLMTAFLLVLGGFSATILLPYIHWLLYTLLFILYWWMLKGVKSKFWRFILALLLTLLTIGLIQGLFGALSPDAEGFFKSLSKSFAGIQFPETPGVPDYLTNLFGAPTTAAPTGPELTTLPPTVTPFEEKKEGWLPGGHSAWNLLWVLPLLAVGVLGGIKGVRTLSRGRRRKEQQKAQILNQIKENLANTKQEKQNTITALVHAQRERNSLLSDALAKGGYMIRLQQLSDEDLANLYLDESRALINREEGDIKRIMEHEAEFANQLKNLYSVEHNFYNNSDNIKRQLGANLHPERQKIALPLLELIKVLIGQNIRERPTNERKGILWLIAVAYNIEKKEESLAKELSAFLDERNIKELVKDKLKSVREEFNAFNNYNERENEVVVLLNRRVDTQIVLIDRLIRVIEEELAQLTQTVPAAAPPQQPGAPAAQVAPAEAQAPAPTTPPVTETIPPGTFEAAPQPTTAAAPAQPRRVRRSTTTGIGKQRAVRFSQKAFTILATLPKNQQKFGEGILDLCVSLEKGRFNEANRKIVGMYNRRIIDKTQTYYLASIIKIVKQNIIPEALKLAKLSIFKAKSYDILREFLKNY